MGEVRSCLITYVSVRSEARLVVESEGPGQGIDWGA